MAHYDDAGVAESADALDLGSSVFRRGGSTPFTRTIQLNNLILCGSSSVVEYLLAKEGVAGSNPVFRSNEKFGIWCCRGGGTGRRTGLKILRCVNTVPVRFRSSAPLFAPVAQLDRVLDYGSRG